MNLKGKFIVGLEAVRRQKVAGEAKMVPGGMVSRGLPGFRAGLKVKSGGLEPLLSILHAGHSLVEMTDDFKQAAFDVLAFALRP